MLFVMLRKVSEHVKCLEKLNIYLWGREWRGAGEEKKQKRGKGMMTRAISLHSKSSTP